MEYNLELNKVIEEIKKNNAKTICIQLTEGLKPRAKEIQETIQKKTNADVLIWADSCFGACDIPKLDVDLLIQFGHSEWKV